MRLHIHALPDAASAVQASGPPGGLKKLGILAYTGGPMRLPGWGTPVALDLRGVTVRRQDIPILHSHDTDRIVGHTISVTVGKTGIMATGVVSGSGKDADAVVRSGSMGYPWQASVGATADKVEHKRAGEKVQVNGRELTGPLVVVRAATLAEISVTALGADSSTKVDITARRRAAGVDVWACSPEPSFSPPPPPPPPRPVPAVSLVALAGPFPPLVRPGASCLATHEAGHAVASVVLGLGMRHVVVHADGGEVRNVLPDGDVGDWPAEDIRDRMTATAAGYAAEVLAHGKIDYFAPATQWGSDMSSLAILMGHYHRKQPDGLTPDPFAAAIKLLSDSLNWRATIRVSRELDRRHRLDSDEVF
jgi:hypothetical protein